jgi:putative transposase
LGLKGPIKVLSNKDKFMAITNDILDGLIGNAKTQEDLFGKDGVIKTLSKQLLERMLEAEMTHHLGYEKHAIEGRKTGNSRNGKNQKMVKTGSGEITVEVPRDRQSEFQSLLIEKRQSRLRELDDQVLLLYSRGMTVRDIQDHVCDIYGTEISADLVSTITNAVLGEVTEWWNRPLDSRP